MLRVCAVNKADTAQGQGASRNAKADTYSAISIPVIIISCAFKPSDGIFRSHSIKNNNSAYRIG